MNAERGGFRGPFAVALAVLFVTATAAAAPDPAHAGIWDDEQGGNFTYYGEPGERNQITVEFDGSFVTVTDVVPVRSRFEYDCEQDPGRPGCPGGPAQFSPSDDEFGEVAERCARTSATSFRCEYHGTPGDLQRGTLGEFELGDGDDALAFAGPAPPSDTPLSQLIVNAGAGDDTLAGSPYTDDFEGGDGVDTLSGEAGNDSLYPGGQSNRVDGGPGNDNITILEDAADVTNVLIGGSGDDNISGSDGDDQIDAGEGDDELYGVRGNDMLLGQPGDDYLIGGSGKDLVDGGPDDDFLEEARFSGCEGPSTYVGGPGEDLIRLFCGAPTIRLRDRQPDKAVCRNHVKPVSIKADLSDRLRGECKREKKEKG